MQANDRQVDGTHYRSEIQHWDYVIANDLDYFQAQITKYVTRWKKKNGIKDLEKAQHFLEKYLETIRNGAIPTAPKAAQQSVNLSTASLQRVLPHYEAREHFETEGFVVDGDYWRCKSCRERFMVPVGVDPERIHKCPEGEPTAGYVDQG